MISFLEKLKIAFILQNRVRERGILMIIEKALIYAIKIA